LPVFLETNGPRFLFLKFHIPCEEAEACIKKERENPKEIQGKQALFVVNLPIKEIFGERSEGMLFDIGYENKITPVLAIPEKQVPNGSSAE